MTQSRSTQEWPNNTFTLGLFSYQLDGWADLIEGKGDKQDQVQNQVFSILTERNMPDVEVTKKIAKPSSFSSVEQRKYIVTSTAPGVSTAIYIGAHGKDLFVSWRTFIKPVVNSTLLLFIFCIAVSISFLVSSTRFLSTLTDRYSYSGNPFAEALLTGFLTFIACVIIPITIIAFLGMQIKKYSLAYFFVEPTYFNSDDITAMSLYRSQFDFAGFGYRWDRKRQASIEARFQDKSARGFGIGFLLIGYL